MKARITEIGVLQIERAGEWKTQFCPYHAKFCGDWCPSFDEDASLNKTDLMVCGIPFSVVEDLRGKG